MHILAMTTLELLSVIAVPLAIGIALGSIRRRPKRKTRKTTSDPIHCVGKHIPTIFDEPSAIDLERRSTSPFRPDSRNP